MSTSHGSSPREPSTTAKQQCSGRCPGVWRTRIATSPSDDLLPVCERLVRVLGLRSGVDVNGNAVLEREPPVPGDVVGVRVRLEHAL